jgi:hypothetical protein
MLLEIAELLSPRFERVLRHLDLHMLLVPVRKQLLDDARELCVLGQRLLPVLFKVLQLAT